VQLKVQNSMSSERYINLKVLLSSQLIFGSSLNHFQLTYFNSEADDFNIYPYIKFDDASLNTFELMAKSKFMTVATWIII
jgi:hypothetical protein